MMDQMHQDRAPQDVADGYPPVGERHLPVELRATWTRSGPDSYRVNQSQRAGKDWKPLWTMELKRKAK